MYGKLNKTKINSGIAKAFSQKKAVTLSDGQGLHLVLSPVIKGKGVWYQSIRIDGKQKKLRVGEFFLGASDSMDIEEARAKAYEMKKDIEDKKEVFYGVTVKELASLYLKYKGNALSKSTRVNYDGALKTLTKVGIADLKAENLTPNNLRNSLQVLKDNKQVATVKNAYLFLSAIVKFGMGEQYIKPVALPTIRNLFPDLESLGTRKMLPFEQVGNFIESLVQKASSKRSDKDIETIRAITLIICTAGRLNEILGLEEPELDGNWWRIPANRMKARRPHLVYIPDELLPIFRYFKYSYVVLQSKISRYCRKFEAQAHGFRSLFMTKMYQLHPEMKDAISACIAHGKEHTNQSDKFYNQYNFEDERKFLFNKWFETLKENSNILELIEILKGNYGTNT
ncbi:hypothetical protein CKF54_00535 [Psittacicella hinzii]|uniref:Core-binding (CB) domain-containing protein n=1 Tax=Psittacicella hinzii TaxID=2028575 RepID=A0A3A1YEN1_9GAMM|nr:integrase family protein [Psittacicella hinzii]RIY34517.1 hypothetical protein CKF54_00535 [Psittacicella hinzii]